MMTTGWTWRWPTPDGLPPLPLVGGASALLAGLWLAAPVAEVDFVRMAGSIGKMAAFAQQMFVAPNWQYVPQLLTKMLETIEMTLLATAIATVLSLPAGILAARNATPHPFVYRVTRDLLSLRRPQSVGIGLADAVRLVSANPARAAGLTDRGEIAVGKRADLIAVAHINGLAQASRVFSGGKPAFEAHFDHE